MKMPETSRKVKNTRAPSAPLSRGYTRRPKTTAPKSANDHNPPRPDTMLGVASDASATPQPAPNGGMSGSILLIHLLNRVGSTLLDSQNCVQLFQTLTSVLFPQQVMRLAR